MSKQVLNRRDFLKGTALAGAGFWLGIERGFAASKSPNDKLSLGIIGVANRAAENIDGVRGQNIVALCDIDQNFLGEAAEEFPKARTYTDFRKLLEHPGLDAV